MFEKLRNIFHVKPLTRESSTEINSVPGGYIDLLQPTSTAMNVATVFACVNILSARVSNLNIYCRKWNGGIFKIDEASPYNHFFNTEPNGEMSAAIFWNLAVNHYLLKGNVYVVPIIDKERLKLTGLYLVNPGNVVHDSIRNIYHIYGTPVDGVYEERDIVHVINQTTDGKTGISTLQYARIATDTASAGDIEQLKRFKSGGNVHGILSNDRTAVTGFGQYQDKQLKDAAVNLDQKFRSGERIVSIPGSAQFSPITLSSQDMQFIDARRVNGIDICRFFQVPPEFVFYNTSTNYKSVGMQNSAFLDTALNPILRKFEKELTRKLIPRECQDRKKIEFDRSGLYDCDLETKSAYQKNTIETGQYTVNEWRAINNMPPVSGGDMCLVSANLKPITEVGEKNDKEENKI